MPALAADEFRLAVHIALLREANERRYASSEPRTDQPSTSSSPTGIAPTDHPVESARPEDEEIRSPDRHPDGMADAVKRWTLDG
jgi:hypothetical protein